MDLLEFCRICVLMAMLTITIFFSQLKGQLIEAFLPLSLLF